MRTPIKMLFASLMLVSDLASAQTLVTIHFDATIDGLTGISESVHLGDRIVGNYSYEYPSVPQEQTIDHSYYSWAGAATGFDIYINGEHTISDTTYSPRMELFLQKLDYNGGYIATGRNLTALSSGEVIEGIHIDLNDFNGDALLDALLHDSPPPLNTFENRHVFLDIRQPNGVVIQAFGNVRLHTTQLVPPPFPISPEGGVFTQDQGFEVSLFSENVESVWVTVNGQAVDPGQSMCMPSIPGYWVCRGIRSALVPGDNIVSFRVRSYSGSEKVGTVKYIVVGF